MTDAYLANIESRRAALRKEMDELDIAERHYRSFSGNDVAARPRIRLRPRRADGLSQQHADVLSLIDAEGGNITRGALLEAINKDRPSPLLEATYAALLSKMKSLELISRDEAGNVMRFKKEEDDL